MSIQSFKDALSYARRENYTVEERRRELFMSFEEYERIVLDEGIAIGKAKGKEEGIAIGEAKRDAEHVKNMALRGLKESDIAIALGMSEAEVRGILAKAA